VSLYSIKGVGFKFNSHFDESCKSVNQNYFDKEISKYFVKETRDGT